MEVINLKKIKIAIPLLIFWILIAVILHKYGLLTTDINKFYAIIENNPGKMEIIFLLLATLRIVIFLPISLFVIIGSALFGVLKGSLLSVVAIFFSQSILFLIGKLFGDLLMEKSFVKKKLYLVDGLEKYGYKLLALGTICPVAPLDLMTVLSACLNLKYYKSMLIIIISYSPLMLIYALLGANATNSTVLKIISLLTIIIISLYSYKIFRKITAKK